MDRRRFISIAGGLGLGILLPYVSVFAQSWSGYLVDSKCYDAEERNVNPFDTSPEVDRDKDLDIRLCTPSLKTKSFAVVPEDGSTNLKLDPVGTEKAIALIRKTGKKSFRKVTVTGEMNKNTVKVNSISDAR